MESTQPTACKIEHHATLFALLAKHAVTLCGEEGKSAILEGMTLYGRERGQRMAQNALANGDELNLLTYQLYGEWVPEYPGQMESGIIRREPTYQNWVSRCAWCEAWNKHNLLEYGRLYCINVDKAVFEGFREDFECTLLGDNLSFGGERCLFDWAFPLTEEEEAILSKRRSELGLSCTKDFTFHTAHILHTVGSTLEEQLGHSGTKAVQSASADYISLFGQEYYDILNGAFPG